MATCKDCLHCNVCYMVEHYGVDLNEDMQKYDCHQFQAKTNCVEVVHGRWLRIGSKGKLSGKRVWQYVCSECKTLGSPNWKCCPVCTARMDGGNEDGL